MQTYIHRYIHHPHRHVAPPLGSPWPSPATRIYRPSLPVVLQCYILNRHRAVVCRFLPVVLPLLVHVKGSTGVCRLCVRPYFSSKVLHVWFVLLCFDLLNRPKMPFKVMHRKEVTHSSGSYERKSRGRKLVDEMGRGKKKSHYTLIDWRTGREWPLNCMTVVSARWLSHRPFQR